MHWIRLWGCTGEKNRSGLCLHGPWCLMVVIKWLTVMDFEKGFEVNVRMAVRKKNGTLDLFRGLGQLCNEGAFGVRSERRGVTRWRMGEGAAFTGSQETVADASSQLWVWQEVGSSCGGSICTLGICTHHTQGPHLKSWLISICQQPAERKRRWLSTC